MNTGAETELTIACMDVVHRFYCSLDAGDYDTLVAQMSPDGVWERQGKTLEGRNAVRDALRQRGDGVTTTHLVQNLVVDRQDARTATASMYVVVLRHEGAGPHGEPPVTPPIRTIQRVRDVFVLTDQGWRISHKSGHPIFRHAA